MKFPLWAICLMLGIGFFPTFLTGCLFVEKTKILLGIGFYAGLILPLLAQWLINRELQKEQNEESSGSSTDDV